MCCGGKCLRSFHPKCLGLTTVDVDRIVRSGLPLICSDCSLGVQRCFSCRNFGLEDELVPCGVKFCGKFYHASCLSDKSFHDPSSSGNASMIVCPLHICGTCGVSHTDLKKRSLMLRCFRCPKAYDIMHRPRDVHVLSGNIFLCIKHTLIEETWPDLPDSLVKRAKSRIRVSKVTLCLQ